MHVHVKQNTLSLSPAAKAKEQSRRYRACSHLYHLFGSDAYIRTRVSQHQIEVLGEDAMLRCPPEYAEVADQLIAEGKPVLSMLKRDLLGAMLRHLKPRLIAELQRAAKPKPPQEPQQQQQQQQQLERTVKERPSTVVMAKTLYGLLEALEPSQATSFIGYCDQKFGIKSSQVYRLLDFAEQLEMLRLPGVPAPENERQVRGLKKLPKEEWVAAWKEANRGCRGKVSGRQVNLVVSEMLRQKASSPASGDAGAVAPPKKPVSSPDPDTLSSASAVARPALPDPSMSRPHQPVEGSAAKRWRGRMCCFLGLHDWDQHTAVVKDDAGDRRPIALGWVVCRRCSESKLKMILR